MIEPQLDQVLEIDYIRFARLIFNVAQVRRSAADEL